jgi:hypothetical protein
LGDGDAWELWEADFKMHDGYVSAGETIEQSTMTVEEAKQRCSSFRGVCKGFTFQTAGALDDGPAKMYFKTKFDNVPNNVHNKGWTSYELKEVNKLATSNVFSFMVFGVLALFAAVLLYLMLGGHLPLATHNLTTTEANYDNSANPFDHGGTIKNLEQVMGVIGVDWLLPIKPWRPVTDGVSFARSDEQWGDASLDDDGLALVEDMSADPEAKERLWRQRYGVRAPPTAMPAREQNTGFWTCR